MLVGVRLAVRVAVTVKEPVNVGPLVAVRVAVPVRVAVVVAVTVNELVKVAALVAVRVRVAVPVRVAVVVAVPVRVMVGVEVVVVDTVAVAVAVSVRVMVGLVLAVVDTVAVPVPVGAAVVASVGVATGVAECEAVALDDAVSVGVDVMVAVASCAAVAVAVPEATGVGLAVTIDVLVGGTAVPDAVGTGTDGVCVGVRDPVPVAVATGVTDGSAGVGLGVFVAGAAVEAPVAVGVPVEEDDGSADGVTVPLGNGVALGSPVGDGVAVAAPLSSIAVTSGGKSAAEIHPSPFTSAPSQSLPRKTAITRAERSSAPTMPSQLVSPPVGTWAEPGRGHNSNNMSSEVATATLPHPSARINNSNPRVPLSRNRSYIGHAPAQCNDTRCAACRLPRNPSTSEMRDTARFLHRSQFLRSGPSRVGDFALEGWAERASLTAEIYGIAWKPSLKDSNGSAPTHEPRSASWRYSQCCGASPRESRGCFARPIATSNALGTTAALPMTRRVRCRTRTVGAANPLRKRCSSGGELAAEATVAAQPK